VADTSQIDDALGRGDAVLFFPEGTFTHTVGLRPFRLGAFKAAAERGLPVDRWDAQQGVADTSQIDDALRGGDAVLFFAEGTFTHTVGLRPFRLGAFKAAAERGLSVVPIALTGTRRWLRPWWAPRPGPVRIWIGHAVRPEGEGWRAVVSLRDRVAEQIAAHCGEPRLDLVAAGPERE
ncbi:MAG TPA: 1-acyl-sn-glycerol-3-phosphate acyltransferase, partial [Vicinamibacteria bacterium]|nr:1-acyl-sn-glycerol-3-phosphate acyltransferase [Vicinamibacteria bacterium]